MEATDHIKEFKTFFEEHVDTQRESIKKDMQERSEFLREYPLERMKVLTAEEYCLGTERSKDSLCYQLEFGKYKHTGFGIGGGSAKKFGVYYNKNEHCYKRGSDVIEDIDIFWPQFRDEVCRFILNP